MKFQHPQAPNFLMGTEQHIGIEALLRNPADGFATPRQVVDDSRLTLDQKRVILLEWKQDARALSVADDEGMPAGHESMLRRVMIALEAIDSVEVCGWHRE